MNLSIRLDVSSVGFLRILYPGACYAVVWMGTYHPKRMGLWTAHFPERVLRLITEPDWVVVK